MAGPFWAGQRRMFGDKEITLQAYVARHESAVRRHGWTYAVEDGSWPTGPFPWMSCDDLEDKTTPIVPVPPEPRRHSHYFRSVAGLQEIDVYRVLELFGVTDQALGHAIKKLVVPGMRGGGKTGRKDIEEAVDTLRRRLEMMDEDDRRETGFQRPRLVFADDGGVNFKWPAPPQPPEGFTAWDGSSEDGPSLPTGGLVDLVFRDGDAHNYCNPACYTWRHRTRSDDIVAYRVSNSKAVAPWYPDDSGAWVEVLGDTGVSPVPPDTVVQTLSRAERANRRWPGRTSAPAAYWDWSNIVAYRQVPRV